MVVKSFKIFRIGYYACVLSIILNIQRFEHKIMFLITVTLYILTEMHYAFLILL